MKAFVLLFSDRDTAAAKAGALARQGWNVVLTGPNDGVEIRQDDDFVAKLASDWTVLASQQELQNPND
jgi:hypothetical protein